MEEARFLIHSREIKVCMQGFKGFICHVQVDSEIIVREVEVLPCTSKNENELHPLIVYQLFYILKKRLMDDLLTYCEILLKRSIFIWSYGFLSVAYKNLKHGFLYTS